MSVNVNSITDSYNAWYDYKYGKNTRGLTSADIAEIETRWKGNLASWKSQAEKDENKYEITDDKADDAKQSGKEKAASKTGCDGKADTGKTIASTVATGAVGIASAALGAITAASSKAFISKSGHGSLIAAQLSAASGTLLYSLVRMIRSANPNGEQADALTELGESILPDAQGQLGEAQSNMEDASEAVADLTEEANATNEDANDEMADSKAEFDMYKNTVETLTQKLQNGEPLTDAEKEFLKEAVAIMEELGININDIAEANTDTTNEIYDEIGGYQEVFDDSAESIEEVQGIVDYAAGFDEKTLENTNTMQSAAIMGIAGSAGAVTGGAVSIARGAVEHPWINGNAMMKIIFGGVGVGMGTAAGLQYYKLKEEQEKYGKIADAEIQVRQFTNDLTDGTRESYDEQIAFYDDNVGIVEDLEMYVPEDIQAPEIPAETPVTAGGNEDTAPGAAGGDKSDKTNGTAAAEKDNASGEAKDTGSSDNTNGTVKNKKEVK